MDGENEADRVIIETTWVHKTHFWEKYKKKTRYQKYNLFYALFFSRIISKYLISWYSSQKPTACRIINWSYFWTHVVYPFVTVGVTHLKSSEFYLFLYDQNLNLNLAAKWVQDSLLF